MHGYMVNSTLFVGLFESQRAYKTQVFGFFKSDIALEFPIRSGMSCNSGHTF